MDEQFPLKDCSHAQLESKADFFFNQHHSLRKSNITMTSSSLHMRQIFHVTVRALEATLSIDIAAFAQEPNDSTVEERLRDRIVRSFILSVTGTGDEMVFRLNTMTYVIREA
jgi:hypothetical protein